MSNQSRRLNERIIKFYAEMKKNNYPNATSFAQLLRELDLYENEPYACSPRTVMRDIKTLKEVFNAPIAYDPVQRGYYLTNPNWELQCPVIEEDVLSMNLVGTRLASDFLPEPLKSDVNSAMDKALAANNSEFFSEAMIESLLCASGIKSAVDPAVFKKVFEAWRRHQVLAMTYKKPNHQPEERNFEPHIIAFHRGNWYTKGYEYGTKDIKCYAIHRIIAVTFGGDTFESDKKLLNATKRNGLFEYPKIDGIQLRCDASIAFYLYEHQKMKKFKVEPQKDGSLLVTLRPAFEHEVLRWVLSEGGRIEVVYPPELRRKVAEAGLAVASANRD